MKRLKILFVQPAFSGGARLALGRAAWVCEPVSLTSLAALAPEHEARVLDLRIEGGAALGPALRDMRPDLVVVAPDEGETAPARAVLRVARGLLGRAAATALAAPPGDAEPPPREDPAIDTVIQGDPEPAFQALLAHLAGGGDPRRFDPGALPPLDLDSLPPPARHLLAPYRRHYFFAVAQPAAALRTARGARRMSAETICDRLQIIPEDFVLLLDDDAFSDPLRLAQLAEALVRRDIHKYWAAQARPEHIAEHPHLALALRDAGLAAVILHFDVGEADGLEMLLDPTIAARSRRAAGVLRALGIAAAGLFTVRRDLGDDEALHLAAHVRELGIAWPIVRAAPRRGSAATAPSPAPLPSALTADHAGAAAALIGGSWEQAAWELARRRPGLLVRALPGVARALGRSFRGRAGVSSAA